MWKNLKAIAAAVDSLAAELKSVHETLHTLAKRTGKTGDLDERLKRLELGMGKALADAESLVTKAESRFNAARASEVRAQRYRQEILEAEGEAEGDGMDGDEAGAVVGAVGSGGGAQGVRALPGGGEYRPAPAEDVARFLKFQR